MSAPFPAESFEHALLAVVERYGQKLNDNQIIEGLQAAVVRAHIEADGDILLDGVPAKVLCWVGEWAWVAKDKDSVNPETVSVRLLTRATGQ